MKLTRASPPQVTSTARVTLEPPRRTGVSAKSSRSPSREGAVVARLLRDGRHAHAHRSVDLGEAPAEAGLEPLLDRRVQHLVVARIEDDLRRVAVLEAHRLGEDEGHGSDPEVAVGNVGVSAAGRAGPDGAAALEDEAAVGDAEELLQRLVDDQDRQAVALQRRGSPPRSPGARPAPGLRSPRRGSAGADWSSARGRWPASAARRPTACCAVWRAALAEAREQPRRRRRASSGRGGRRRRGSPRRSGAGSSGGPRAPGRCRAGRCGATARPRVGRAGEGDRAVARAAAGRRSMRMVVVLPMPLRPISATTSPSPTSRSTPNSAWLGAVEGSTPASFSSGFMRCLVPEVGACAPRVRRGSRRRCRWR